ncbi:MAG: helix-turn-helix transcriptional regulator [Pseudomonadaceae bacterium]
MAAGPDTNCVSPVAADAFRIIRIREVSELTGLGRGTIYQRIKSDPTFPRPVPLSDSTARGAPVGFVLSEVQAWVLSRMAKRDVAA